MAIAFLRSIVMRLGWDITLHRMLEGMRLVFVPLVNPGGVVLGTRANPDGVDLMRSWRPSDAARPGYTERALARWFGQAAR